MVSLEPTISTPKEPTCSFYVPGVFLMFAWFLVTNPALQMGAGIDDRPGLPQGLTELTFAPELWSWMVST